MKGSDLAKELAWKIGLEFVESGELDCETIYDALEGKEVVSSEKWDETLKLANVELDRAKAFKERHDEDHLKLAEIREHIKKTLESSEENLKIYTPFEPTYSKICGKIEVLKELVRLLEAANEGRNKNTVHLEKHESWFIEEVFKKRRYEG